MRNWFRRPEDPRVRRLGEWLVDALKAEPGWDEMAAELRPTPDAVPATLWVRYGPHQHAYDGAFTPGCAEEALVRDLAAEQGWTTATLLVTPKKNGTTAVTLTPRA